VSSSLEVLQGASSSIGGATVVAIGDTAGTRPAPTSTLRRWLFRTGKTACEARARSQAHFPYQRPPANNSFIDTKGARLRSTSISGHGCKPVGPGWEMPQLVKVPANLNESERSLRSTAKRHNRETPARQFRLPLMISFTWQEHLRTRCERRVVKVTRQYSGSAGTRVSQDLVAADSDLSGLLSPHHSVFHVCLGCRFRFIGRFRHTELGRSGPQ